MMRAKSHQLNDVSRFIHPNQQKIVLDMALHASLVFSVHFMWFIYKWYFSIVDVCKVLTDQPDNEHAN